MVPASRSSDKNGPVLVNRVTFTAPMVATMLTVAAGLFASIGGMWRHLDRQNDMERDERFRQFTDVSHELSRLSNIVSSGILPVARDEIRRLDKEIAVLDRRLAILELTIGHPKHAENGAILNGEEETYVD